jgi:hypothetical protein
MAEDVFKDVEVLKGTTAKQFMDTMGLFSASLNANCTACHVEEAGGDWARYADDHPNKEKARRMVDMVAGINRTYFWGRPVVTCYSCHRFGSRPKVIPSCIALRSTRTRTRSPRRPRAGLPSIACSTGTSRLSVGPSAWPL